MTGRHIEISLDTQRMDTWKKGPTIALGLGFNVHTHRVLRDSGLDSLVRVEFEPGPDGVHRDVLKFRDMKNEFRSADDFADEDHNVALVARYVDIASGNVHFICAGLNAPGTKAAGEYLAQRWQELAALYEKEARNVDEHSLAVLIQVQGENPYGDCGYGFASRSRESGSPKSYAKAKRRKPPAPAPGQPLPGTQHAQPPLLPQPQQILPASHVALFTPQGGAGGDPPQPTAAQGIAATQVPAGPNTGGQKL
jgi:hypothetical protein